MKSIEDGVVDDLVRSSEGLECYTWYFFHNGEIVK